MADLSLERKWAAVHFSVSRNWESDRAAETDRSRFATLEPPWQPDGPTAFARVLARLVGRQTTDRTLSHATEERVDANASTTKTHKVIADLAPQPTRHQRRRQKALDDKITCDEGHKGSQRKRFHPCCKWRMTGQPMVKGSNIKERRFSMSLKLCYAPLALHSKPKVIVCAKSHNNVNTQTCWLTHPRSTAHFPRLQRPRL